MPAFEDGFSHGRDLLRLADPPSAVVCGNDLQAFGVYEAARLAGVRIPEDLSVVGFDDISYARWCGPPLTTVQQPSVELEATAVRAMTHPKQSLRSPIVSETLPRIGDPRT